MATVTNNTSASSSSATSASSSPFLQPRLSHHRPSPRLTAHHPHPHPLPHSSSVPTTAPTPSTPSKRRIHEANDDSKNHPPSVPTCSSSFSTSTSSSILPSSSSSSSSSTHQPMIEPDEDGSSVKKRQKQLAGVEEESTGEASESNEADKGRKSVEMTTEGRVIKVLPHEYMHTDQEDLVILIASMLVKLIQHNDQVPLLPEHLTRFHSRSPPSISVVDYLRRIVKYTNIEKSPLLLLLPYLDAFCQHLPSFTLSSLTVHRFLISSACVASKALCDSFCTNAHYAKVGGIRVEELNLLERELVSGLGWKLVVEGSLLQDYYASLISSYASTAPPPPSSSSPPTLAYTQGPLPLPKPSPPPPPYLPWPSWEACEARYGRPKVASNPLAVPD